MSRRKKWVSALVLGAVVATTGSVSGAVLASSGGGPDVEVATDFGKDPYTHYVLALDAPAAAASASAAVPEIPDVVAKAPAGTHADLGAGTYLILGDQAWLVEGDDAVLVGSENRTHSGTTELLNKGAQWLDDTAPAPRAPVVEAPSKTVDEAPVAQAPAAQVLMHSPVSDDQLRAIEASAGVKSAQVLFDNTVLVIGDLSLAAAKSLPGVVSAEESQKGEVFAANPTDPYFPGYGYNLENTGSNAGTQTGVVAGIDTDATAGWDASQGQGMVIAVTDTGFDSDHPDMVGSLWTNTDEACGSSDLDGNGKAGDCNGWNFYANSRDIDNGAGGTHGTSVSGIAAARANNDNGSAGVAPRASIMPLVIGSGDSVDAALGAQAIRYAVDNGADVINASWGGDFTGVYRTNLDAAIEYARTKGVIVVAAAGNDNADRDAAPRLPAAFTHDNIITVGSIGANGQRAASSAWGKQSVDIFAPGVLTLTTWNDGGYRMVGGTSLAAPQVAAAVAMYKSVRPDASYSTIKSEIMSDSVKMSNLTSISVSGGRLSLRNLVPSASDTLEYSFSSMVARPGITNPKVSIDSSTRAGQFSVKLGLAMEHEGEIWAVSDKEITLNGQVQRTGQDGFATFDLGSKPYLGDITLSPSIELGAGKFALVAQVLKDSSPMGRPYAAPLVVSTSATIPSPNVTTPSTPTTPNPGPTTTTPTNPNPGPTTTNPNPGPTTNPTTPNPTTTNPGPTTTTPTNPNPGPTQNPTTTPTNPNPGPTTNPTTPNPTTTPTTPNPTTPNPTTTNPGPTTTTPTNPNPGPTTNPTTPNPTTTPTTPNPGPTEKEYPEVGAFKLTSINPSVVNTTGGTIVTISGDALPSAPRVRIGTTTPAELMSTGTNQLSFRAPALVVGTYDVYVFDAAGQSSVLTGGLTVRSEVPTGGPNPTTTTPTNPNPGPTQNPTTTPKPTTTPTTPTPTTTPTQGTPRVTTTGPNGEKLVKNDDFSAMRAVFSSSCASGCAGIQV